MMEDKLIFKKIDGTHIGDIEKYVKDWVKVNPYGTVTIGCDSQVHGRKIKYSVVVVMHKIDRMGAGKGAHVVSADIWTKRLNNATQLEEMPNKLWKEAEFVLKVAEMVDGKDEAFKKKITVHLDFNSKESEESHMLFASGLGFIKGMGYKAEGKPFAWAATHTADALCRHGSKKIR